MEINSPIQKKYTLKKLIDDGQLEELRERIKSGTECGRIPKLRALQTNESIGIFVGRKTFEYELCRANVYDSIADTVKSSFLNFYLSGRKMT